MISLVVNGTDYSGFTSVQVERALDTISGSFTFEAVSSENISFPIQRGSPCQVKVDGTSVVNGYVEIIDVSYDATSHRISIQGRDKTCDVIDSQLDAKVEFKAPISLESVIQKTLASINATDIQVINNVSGLSPFQKGELVSAENGQNAFEFLEKFARKRQVLLTSDGNGNILITRAGQEKIALVLKNVVGGKDNNIKSASANYNDTERFSLYTCKSQGNISTLDEEGGNTSPSAIVTRKAESTDPFIRSSRVMVFTAEKSSSPLQAQLRATWEANVRRARSFKYSATVVGHKVGENGEPWRPSMLVNVIDDFSDINSELVVNKVTFTYDLTGGSLTALECLFKDSYIPEPIKTPKKNEDNFGGGFNA